jgi:GcrA cell cycle regulator
MGAPSQDWSDGQIDTLRTMWVTSAGVVEIASAVGKSRNAIVGKARRLNLPPKAGYVPSRKPPESRESTRARVNANYQRTRRVPVAGQGVMFGTAAYDRADPTPVPPERVIPECRMIDLADIEANDCRWPIGDNPNIKFCGVPKQVGSSYCPYHKRVNHP